MINITFLRHLWSGGVFFVSLLVPQRDSVGKDFIVSEGIIGPDYLKSAIVYYIVFGLLHFYWPDGDRMVIDFVRLRGEADRN